MSAKIAISGLAKRFGSKRVLENVNLDVETGTSLVVIGQSGTGKSVLIKCLLGLLRPDAGSILVDGEEMVSAGERAQERIRAKFGMLFQGGALFDSLPVWRNVTFGLTRGLYQSPARMRAIAQENLERVGLGGDILSLRPSELSGGMQKRVALARAIAPRPEILLFDEPTTGLDPITSDTVDNEIIKLRDLENVSSIVVTHQLRDAFRIAIHEAVRENNEVRIISADAAKREEAEFIMLRDGGIAFEGHAAELRAATDPYLQAFLS